MNRFTLTQINRYLKYQALCYELNRQPQQIEVFNLMTQFNPN